MGSETQFFCRAECTVAALFGFMGALFGSAPFPASLRMGSQKNEVGKVASGDQPGGWVVQPDELGRAPRYVRTHCNSPFLSFTGRLRTYVEPFRSTFSIQDKNFAGVLPPSGRRIRDPVMFSELSGEERRRGGHRCGPPQTFGRGAPTRRSQM